MILRPSGILVSGELHLGLEVERENGRILSVRPHSGIPDAYFLSVPFVNAHSHLEYRGFLNRITGLGYWDWIRELTRLKADQSEEEVLADCRQAALENRQTGVARIGEHSDRPSSGRAMAEAGLNGILFQEIITFFERESRMEKLASVRSNANKNAEAFSGPIALNPHALYTVDPETLAERGRTGDRLSLHLAESVHERELYENGAGPIAEFYKKFGVPVEATGRSPVEVARDYGLVREGMQLVHCCDLSLSDIEIVAASGASVAHCPRSNAALGCPDAPVFELLRMGVDVGLGMDSAASGGPIDFFAEMRASQDAALRRGRPLKGEQVWNMATTMGARTLGIEGWDLSEGFEGPLIALECPDAEATDDLIAACTPERVRWIE